MAEKIHQPEWKPDFGPAERHPTAGTVAIGARMPLVAYNVNLGTNQLQIATDIAKKIRFIGGGLRYCKAMGVELKERGIVQVSINMTDYTYGLVPGLRVSSYRSSQIWCSGGGRRDYRLGSYGGVDRYGLLLFGIRGLLYESSIGSPYYGIAYGE